MLLRQRLVWQLPIPTIGASCLRTDIESATSIAEIEALRREFPELYTRAVARVAKRRIQYLQDRTNRRANPALWHKVERTRGVKTWERVKENV